MAARFSAFGERFDYYLRRSPYSQAELASELNVVTSAITQWKKGINPISKAVLARACELMNLDEDEKQDLFSLAALAEQPIESAKTEAIQKSSASSVPLDIPKSIAHFISRYEEKDKNELTLILKDLALGQIVTLCGPNGIGKTALAVECVRALVPDNKPPERFPDGIFFHSFAEEPSADAALYQIAKVFGDTEPSQPNPRDAARRALMNRHALLVLDGVEQCDDVDKIVNVSGQCGILITTVRRDDVRGKVHFVRLMPRDKSRLLLEAWSQVQLDRIAADQICELLGFLPLALCIAGRAMWREKLSAVEYLEWLQETPLEALTIPQRHDEGVPILIKKSLERVSEASRQTMSVVGALAPAPFDVDLIAAALAESKIKVRQAIGELVDYGLVERTRQYFQVTHTLIYTYAHIHLTVSQKVVVRLASHLVSWLKQCTSFSEYEVMHLRIIRQTSVELGKWKEAKHSLATQVCVMLRHPMAFFSMGLIFATFTKTDLDILIRSQRKWPNWHKTDINENILTLALLEEKQWRELESVRKPFIGYYVDSALADHMISLEFAIETHIELLDRWIEVKVRPVIAAKLCLLGELCKWLDQPNRSVRYFRDALGMLAQSDNTKTQIFALAGLAECHFRLGEHQNAVEICQRILRLSPDEIGPIESLADHYLRTSELEKAKALFQRRVHLNRDNAINAYAKLGVIARLQGNEVEAQRNFESALDALEVWSEVWYQRKLSPSDFVTDQVHRHLQCPEQTLAVTAIGDKICIPLTLWEGAWTKEIPSPSKMFQNQAIALLGLGEEESAIESLKEAAVLRFPGDQLDATIYDLLSKSPNPPQRMAEINDVFQQASKIKSIALARYQSWYQAYEEFQKDRAKVNGSDLGKHSNVQNKP